MEIKNNLISKIKITNKSIIDYSVNETFELVNNLPRNFFKSK